MHHFELVTAGVRDMTASDGTDPESGRRTVAAYWLMHKTASDQERALVHHYGGEIGKALHSSKKDPEGYWAKVQHALKNPAPSRAELDKKAEEQAKAEKRKQEANARSKPGKRTR